MNRDTIQEYFKNIHVDKFQGKRSGTFLLTHFHSDHTYGLNNNWSKGKIYCSFMTKTLMCSAAKNLCLTYIIALPYFVRHRIHKKLAITLYPSNHLVGGAMIHIECCHLSILYTGDYRYSPKLKLPKNIDIAFIDGTFHDDMLKLATTEQSAQLVHQWISAFHNENIYIGFTHLGTCQLLQKVTQTYGHTFSLDSKAFPQDTINIIQKAYPKLLTKNSNILITPARIRGQIIENKVPMLIPSARWSRLPEYQHLSNHIATNHKGLYRINFTNHSDHDDNLQLIKRLHYPSKIYFIS